MLGLGFWVLNSVWGFVLSFIPPLLEPSLPSPPYFAFLLLEFTLAINYKQF